MYVNVNTGIHIIYILLHYILLLLARKSFSFKKHNPWVLKQQGKELTDATGRFHGFKANLSFPKALMTQKKQWCPPSNSPHVTDMSIPSYDS